MTHRRVRVRGRDGGAFWRGALGYASSQDPQVSDLYDPRQLNPVINLQPMDPSETERRRQRNRIHLELLLPADQLRARADTAVAAGGRILDQSPDRYRIADPEDNELDLRR
ncbi:MAG TPA: VOC family protein [Mycobacteriales bacterium]|nr:VOC family protein [Mycobacteriales bacterium]